MRLPSVCGLSVPPPSVLLLLLLILPLPCKCMRLSIHVVVSNLVSLCHVLCRDDVAKRTVCSCQFCSVLKYNENGWHMASADQRGPYVDLD